MACLCCSFALQVSVPVMWLITMNCRSYQIFVLLLSRGFESNSRKLIAKIFDPFFHNILGHQILSQKKKNVFQYLLQNEVFKWTCKSSLLPILFRTSTIFLLVPLWTTACSTCGQRQPKGSLASRTSKITSAASITLSKNK